MLMTSHNTDEFISVEFLRSVLRRHLVGKLVVASLLLYCCYCYNYYYYYHYYYYYYYYY